MHGAASPRSSGVDCSPETRSHPHTRPCTPPHLLHLCRSSGDPAHTNAGWATAQAMFFCPSPRPCSCHNWVRAQQDSRRGATARVLPPCEQNPHSTPVCLSPLEVQGTEAEVPLHATAHTDQCAGGAAPGREGSPRGWGLRYSPVGSATPGPQFRRVPRPGQLAGGLRGGFGWSYLEGQPSHCFICGRHRTPWTPKADRGRACRPGEHSTCPQRWSHVALGQG